jgi:hypothetical protein
MATANVFPLGDGSGLDMFSEDFLDTGGVIDFALSPTVIEIVFSDGSADVFIGEGFAFDGLAVTGGTVTAVEYRIGGRLVGRVEDLALSAATLSGFYLAGDGLGAAEFAFASADDLTGSSADEVLRAFGGDDTIRGGNGADGLFGEDGRDLLLGEGGADDLLGGPGDDTLEGGPGDDGLFGEAGTDTARYAGPRAAYTLEETGEGRFVVSGADGTDELVGIEFIEFADQTVDAGSGSGVPEQGQFIPGNSLDERIEGFGGSDTLEGRGGDDTLVGNGGDDFLRGGAGSDTLEGGEGDDLAIFEGPIGTYDFARRTGVIEVSRGGETDTLVTMEALYFPGEGGARGRTAFLDERRIPVDGVRDGDAIDIAFLYEGALDRDGQIDLPGLNFWIDSFEGFYVPGEGRVPDFLPGITLQQIAEFFLTSEEYRNNFGNPETQSDEAFITSLYENMLDRGPDASGFAFWIEDIGAIPQETPTEAKARVLISFTRSPENRSGEDLAFVFDLAETEVPGEWAFLG